MVDIAVSESDRITVVIADHRSIVREGLGLLLADSEEISIVGEAADGLRAIAAVEFLQPDILLLDIEMPRFGGLEALPEICRKSPRTKVLILSWFSEDGLVTKALLLGAKGYLSKRLRYTDLVKAIRATHAGDIWAERTVLTEVTEDLRHKTQDRVVEHGG